MKRIALLLGAALVCAAPVFAGDGEKGGSDAQSCLDHMSGMKEAKGWVGLEFDPENKTPYVVTKVVHGSPAQKAGFKEGDILSALNGIQLSDKEGMKKAKSAMKPGNKVTYTVTRMGKNTDLAVTLGTMPDEVFAQMVGAHLLQNHVAAAASSTEEKAKADE